MVGGGIGQSRVPEGSTLNPKPSDETTRKISPAGPRGDRVGATEPNAWKSWSSIRGRGGDFTPPRPPNWSLRYAATTPSNPRGLQKRIEALQQSAAELAAREPELAVQVERLCSVPGIGQVSALRLRGELLVLPKELKAKQWGAHAGLDSRPRQSGATDAPRHISRTGNRHLRCALFMPALVAIPRSPEIKAAYEEMLARGKKKKVAIIALMRRLLHAIWGMLHHQRDFNPQRLHASPLPHLSTP